MASDQSYLITIKNNKTEKQAIDFLMTTDSRFINPDKTSRKLIMEYLGIDKKFSRAFDLIIIPGYSNLETEIKIKDNKEIILVELKTTQKKLINNPKGFFFGATENEFNLANLLGDQYKFCFVSLHSESKCHSLLTLKELEDLIITKRTQYQINLKN